MKFLLFTSLFLFISSAFAQRNPLPAPGPFPRIPHDPTDGNNSTSTRRQSHRIPTDSIDEVKKPILLKVLSGFDHPESVLIANQSLFISDMGKEHSSNIKDGNLYKFDLFGNLDRDFTLKDKLVSPMGMAETNDIIYVADVNKVLGFSSFSGAKIVEYDLSGWNATFLNDIAIVENRYLLVTATTLKKIFNIDLKTNKIKEITFDLLGSAPNGIAYDAKKSLVYIAANKEHNLGDYGNGMVFTFSIYGKENRSSLVEQQSMGKFIDGISIGKNTLIVSDWYDRENGSKLYYLNKRSLNLISEFSLGTGGLADFSYDSKSNLLVTPDFINGKIYIYKQ